MSKESRLLKEKNKLKAYYASYTDRQLLELIASSLKWFSTCIAIIIFAYLFTNFFHNL